MVFLAGLEPIRESADSGEVSPSYSSNRKHGQHLPKAIRKRQEFILAISTSLETFSMKRILQVIQYKQMQRKIYCVKKSILFHSSPSPCCPEQCMPIWVEQRGGKVNRLSGSPTKS